MWHVGFIDMFVAGSALKGTTYAHPLKAMSGLDGAEKELPVLCGAHVSMETGTGLVHTAPGHGQEDFIVCKNSGISSFCPGALFVTAH